jgi:hypothetical protein
MTHLSSQKPHVLGYKTFNYTLRVGRRTIKGASFAPDTDTAMRYAREISAAEHDKVSSITVALA